MRCPFFCVNTMSNRLHPAVAALSCEKRAPERPRERYFKYNKDLLLDHRKAALQQELAAEQRRHGGV